MKKIVLFVLLSCTSLQAQFVKENGQLRVVGTQLVNEKGNPIVLRGVSFGWHSLWPRFYNEKAVKWLKKDWNCTVVRAAMGIEHGEDNYMENATASKEKIKAVIDGAINANIYVIIDWHSHNINLKGAKEYFNEVSMEYGKYPNIIYEIFNEPDHESWEDVKAYSEEIISVIRRNDPDNIILVGSPKWDQEVQLPAENPILGYNNLMYTMHFYAATHEKWLRDRVDEAMKNGLPIFVSESAGVEATGDGPLNESAWQDYISWMESKKISWITWSISDKEETCSMLQKTAASTGNWKDTDLKDSGRKTRAYLRALNK